MSRGILKLGIVLLLAASSSAVSAQGINSSACLKTFGQREWAILLKDIDAANKKRLIDDAEFRKSQADNFRQLFAFACEAERLGFLKEKINAAELENIRSEALAAEYDNRFRTVKGYVPFSPVTEAQIAAFYASPANVAKAEDFVDVKLKLLKRANPEMDSRVLAENEQNEAKTLFAKIKISEKAAAALSEPFRSAAGLKVKLQQAQFLARLVAEVFAARISVSDKEVEEYIAGHAEFDSSERRSRAEKLLERAKAGEDFGKLADEFTEDPGNDRDGKKNGGLYSDVPVGMMLKPFEKAALALLPGAISPGLVETDYGFHVIKLEKRSADGQKYDVRHILISTTVKNPDDPDGRELPAKVLVKNKLEAEREQVLMEKVVAENAIVVEEYKPVTAVPAKRVVRTRRK